MIDFLGALVEGDLLATFVNLFEIIIVLDVLALIASTLRSGIRSTR